MRWRDQRLWWKNEIFEIEALGENGVIAGNEVLGQSAGWAAHRLETRPQGDGPWEPRVLEGLSVGMLKLLRNIAVVMTERQCPVS